jgi:RNA polymerase sigma-70 factor (ECF subfamily)
VGHEAIDWERFVTDHAERVLRIALRIVGRLDDAEEVSQEVFQECFQVAAAQGMRDPTGLAVRLATVRSLDRLRRRRARPADDAELRDGDWVTVVGPVDEAEARELADWLRDAIASLPPRQAEVFSLMALEQTSREDAALLLGISLDAVSTALCKARQELGAALDRRSGGRVL